MTMAGVAWRLSRTIAPTLPPLAWIARIGDGTVDVTCGASVRHDEGRAFFEGTWAGPASLASIPDQTTVFGSGIVLRGADLIVVTPSHQLEGVYHSRIGSELVVSNSLVGVLTAAGLQLDPAVDYPSIFGASSELWLLIEEEATNGERCLIGSRYKIPTLSEPVTAQFFENFSVRTDLSVAEVRKPRERPFSSFDDYRSRLSEATTSLFVNAQPYEPVVALSGGYDSTAVAAVAARSGCHRAIGFRTARPSRRDGSVDDSGAVTAGLLGLEYAEFDRLAYLRADGTPEAEFLATGMAGEEIIFRGFGEALRGQTLLTGYFAGTKWSMSHGDDWRHVRPSTTAGASMSEFRLRSDFYNVPLPCFAAVGKPGEPTLLDLSEMAPFRIGGHYDRPIPRRLAEDAGVPRGTFAVTKHASNVILPAEGLDSLTAHSRRSLEAFAAAEGKPLAFRKRRPFGRSERAAIKAAERLHVTGLAAGLMRRQKSLVHFEPEFGNLVLRWAVSVVKDRYRAVDRNGVMTKR